MPTMNLLLDKAAAMCDPPNDSQLARQLHVSRSAVSLWRKGNPAKDEHLAALIDLAQQDPAIAVLIRQEQASTKAERALWGPLWDRLSPATSTVAGALLAVGLAVADFASLHLMSVAAVVAAIVGTELVRRRRHLFGADHAEGSNADSCRRPGAAMA